MIYLCVVCKDIIFPQNSLKFQRVLFFLQKSLFAAVGDNDHGFAQDAVVFDISAFQLINDGAAVFGFIFDFLDDPVEVGIKFCADDVHFFDAEFFKNFG